MRINVQLIIKDSLTKDFFNKQPERKLLRDCNSHEFVY